MQELTQEQQDVIKTVKALLGDVLQELHIAYSLAIKDERFNKNQIGRAIECIEECYKNFEEAIGKLA